MKPLMRLLPYLCLTGIILFLVNCGGESEDPEIDCSLVNLSITVESSSAVTCSSGGSVTVASTGGEDSHEYSIDGISFQSTTLFNNLDEGSFTVTVRDANGCTATVSVSIISDIQNDLDISVTNTTDATCADGGSVTVSATGGQGTLEYSVTGVSFQASSTFDGLDAGDYTVTVRDGNGCTATVQATIASDPGNVTFTSVEVDSGCGTAQGSISITAFGGDGNYQYSIDGGAFGTASTFSNLAQGTYTIAVQDGASCSKSEDIKVLAGTSFSSSIQSIIQNSCAVSGCHVAGTGRQNFTTLSVIQSNAIGIKNRTQSGNMPATGSITQAEIDLIACWVDDGALNN